MLVEDASLLLGSGALKELEGLEPSVDTPETVVALGTKGVTERVKCDDESFAKDCPE